MGAPRPEDESWPTIQPGDFDRPSGQPYRVPFTADQVRITAQVAAMKADLDRVSGTLQMVKNAIFRYAWEPLGPFAARCRDCNWTNGIGVNLEAPHLDWASRTRSPNVPCLVIPLLRAASLPIEWEEPSDPS